MLVAICLCLRLADGVNSSPGLGLGHRLSGPFADTADVVRASCSTTSSAVVEMVPRGDVLTGRSGKDCGIGLVIRTGRSE